MEFKSYVLCFLPLYGSYNSEKLLEYYDLTINEFQIQNKLCRIVTDNASNNITAFKNLIIPEFESLMVIMHRIVMIVVQIKVTSTHMAMQRCLLCHH